jgi:hypothetical protein
MQKADDRKALHNTMRETAARTRELLMAWAPVKTGVPELAEALAKFTRMHRLTVQVLSFLDRDSKGFPIPITTHELAEKVLTILYLAEELDRVYFEDAGYHAPLYPVAPSAMRPRIAPARAVRVSRYCSPATCMIAAALPTTANAAP